MSHTVPTAKPWPKPRGRPASRLINQYAAVITSLTSTIAEADAVHRRTARLPPVGGRFGKTTGRRIASNGGSRGPDAYELVRWRPPPQRPIG